LGELIPIEQSHSLPFHRGRLWQETVSAARILILGVVMDVVYQVIFLEMFFPGGAAIISVLLAFVPYVLLRDPIGRIARHWVAGPASA
jgi:hypothetical protein